MSLSRFKLVFFAPANSTCDILNHLFKKFPENVGKIGSYQSCAFVTGGTGQFMPMPGSDPTSGEVGQLELVDEDRIELLVIDKGGHEQLKETIKELKNVHPYEELAYDVYKLEDL